MATLQPIVLLTDVMDKKINEFENILISDSATFINHHQNQEEICEQTEPLDLCLNGTMLEGLTMVECYPKFKAKNEGSDDDVIFVKEYKIKKATKAKIPRRNPIRKARVVKRFQDYTDESFEEESDNFEELPEIGEDSMDSPEVISAKNEDSEEWNVQNALKKVKHKRRIIHKRNKFAGRRKNPSKIENEKKVPFSDFESLFTSNLLLIKDYIDDVRFVCKVEKLKENEEKRKNNAIHIFKSQAILLALAKNFVDGDVAKYIIA